MLLRLTSFSIQSRHNLTLQNPMERVGTILLKIDRVLAPEETLWIIQTKSQIYS